MTSDHAAQVRHLAEKVAQLAGEAAHWRGVAETLARQLAETRAVLTARQREKLGLEGQ